MSLLLRQRQFEGAGPRATRPYRADGTGLKVWPTALPLLAHLRARLPETLLGSGRPLRVLELGSGCGLLGLGLAAASENVKVLLTDPAVDLEDGNSLEWLSQNVERNREVVGDRASVAKLVWGNVADVEAVRQSHSDGFYLVVGSDLLYEPRQHDALLLALH